MELAQTTQVLNRLSPVGVENHLIFADLEPGVGIVLAVMEELKVDEE
jgi:hypothetical protein